MARSRHNTRRRPKSNPRGVISILPDGFGFVQTAEGEFFVPASKIGGAFDGDEVELAPIHINHGRPQAGKSHNQVGERPSARVVSVLHRAHETLVGRYEVADPFGVVVPSDRRIPYDVFTMRADNPDIPDGAFVRVRLNSFPSRKSAATGVIEEVLGMSEDAPGMDVEAVIGRYKLETAFSQGSIEQADAARVNEADALAHGYRDIRDRFVFTVDPIDARDFDDALSIERLANGEFLLGVHIADVSHYVPWDSSVDLDARRRATSVYAVDRVIPMVPEHLSNDVCSLVPGATRRAMTVDIRLSSTWQVLGVDAYESLIVSSARLSYEQAQCYIEAQDAASARSRAQLEDEPHAAMPLDERACQNVFVALHALNDMAHARMRRRESRGGMDFSSREAKVILDGEGVPLGVRIRTKTDATSCIEEAMILCNECVAEMLQAAEAPSIFRVHDAPSADALADLVSVLHEFGYEKKVPIEDVVTGNRHALQTMLALAKGRPEEELVSSLVLRSMKRAEYRSRCEAHYGLASEAYCHFTSPIRRYPDLVAHRALKALLHDALLPAAQTEAFSWIAEHSSKMERIADACARETQEIKLVEYMARYIGQTLPGIVSGVTSYGLYVRFDNTCEGFLPTRFLGYDYFTFDAQHYRLVGQDTNRSFRLGQPLRVIVHDAPAHARKLDLRLA